MNAWREGLGDAMLNEHASGLNIVKYLFGADHPGGDLPARNGRW
jgi:hypothetical protein